MHPKAHAFRGADTSDVIAVIEAGVKALALARDIRDEA